MKRLPLLLPFMAAALIAAGCGGGEGSTGAPNDAATVESAETAMRDEKPAPEAPKSKAPTSARGPQIKVVDSEFGRVVADHKGEALYLFDKEQSARARCYGACADAWPPVLASGKPRAGTGAKKGLLGTTRRAGGKLQVTYAGHPLYYYVSDSPGTILCQDVEEFGGTWLVVAPSGAAVS